MGAYHFIRYHRLLMAADQLSIEVNSFTNNQEYKNYISYYYSVLKTIYNNISSGLTPQIRESYAKKFAEIEHLRLKFIGSTQPEGKIEHPIALISTLEQIHSNLIYSVDRQIGLGIPRTRQESASKRAAKALGAE